VLKLVRKALFYVLALTIVLAARGFYLERLIAGRYRWSSLALDVLGLAVLMAFFHCLYFVVNRALRPLEQSGAKKETLFAGALRLSFVVLVVFPALLGFIQVHPQKIEPLLTPESAELEYEKVSLFSDGLELRGWFLPNSSNSNAAVLLTHGLNANKQNFLYPAKLLHDMGYPVLIFDLRSHGESDGHTFTFGVKEKADIKSGYDWLRAKFPDRKLFGVGYSAGGAATRVVLPQSIQRYSVNRGSYLSLAGFGIQ
jgi:hypothetical protein